MNIAEKCPKVISLHGMNELLGTRDRVIALVYATWCPYCISFLTVFEREAAGKPDRFLLVEDNEEIVADQYEIQVIPTVLYFENGLVANRLDGQLGVGLNRKQLADFIQACGLNG